MELALNGLDALLPTAAKVSAVLDVYKTLLRPTGQAREHVRRAVAAKLTAPGSAADMIALAT